ncbi:MAG: LysR family transcriptional regulator, partial [Actinobacteria bacterium]|nr:LysR family transcriptional regulator [Actinomycetota bacterium]
GAARVRWAASMPVAEHLVPGWLAALRRQGDAPRVVLTATNSTAVAELVRSGAVDLGLVEGPDPLADLQQVVVGRDELVLVVAPEHPWARRRGPVEAAVLARTPLVTREVGSGTRTALEQALGGPGPAPVLEVSTATAVRESVRAGWGPAVLSRLAVAGYLRERRLVEVAVRGVDLGRRLRAIWVGGAMPPPGPARDLVALAGAARLP